MRTTEQRPAGTTPADHGCRAARGAPPVLARLAVAASLCLAGLHAVAELTYTVAGGGTGDGLPARAVSLRKPADIAIAANGDVYVAETGNHRIRRIAAAGGALTTIAGTGYPDHTGDGGPAVAASIHKPTGIALGPGGDIYFTEAGLDTVRKITVATGVITTIKDNASGIFMGLQRVAVGPGGVVWVTARGVEVTVPNTLARCSAVYRIEEATGATTRILTGTSVYGYTPWGSTWGACQRVFAAIAAAPSGDLLVADSARFQVSRMSASGVETVVAGTGESGFFGDGGLATLAKLGEVSGLAQGPAGTLYIAANSRIRRVNADGIIGTVAGGGTLVGDDGDEKKALDSRIVPVAVNVDGSANVYLIDEIAAQGTGSAHRRVRKVTPSGPPTMYTIAGNGFETYFGDGGDAAAAALATHFRPEVPRNGSANGIAVDAAGAIYVADSGNARVRRIGPGNVLATVAGNGTPSTSGNGLPATQAGILPAGVAVDATGNVYIEDRSARLVRKVSPSTGTISAFAGGGSTDPCATSGASGAASAYSLMPRGISLDPAGRLLVVQNGIQYSGLSEVGTYGCVIRIDPATGIGTHVAGNRIAGFAGDNGQAVSASFSKPAGIATDGLGNIYVSDTGNHRIRRIAAATGMIQTIAGTGDSGFSGDGGPAAAAAISSPKGIAADAAGNVWFNDTGNRRVRKVAAGTGVITTVAGDGSALGRPVEGEDATKVSLLDIDAGLAVDAGGTVYVVTSGYEAGFPDGNRIRRLPPRAAQTIAFAPLPSRTFGDAAFTVSASASSGLPVKFASATPGTCTVLDKSVQILGAGTCSIVASQAGNATVAPAPEVTQSFTVGKASQAITMNSLSDRTPASPPFVVAARSSSGLAVSFSSSTTGVCTVSGNTVTILATGTCTIAADQPGNANFLAAPQVLRSFAVAKSSQAITLVPPGSRAYGSAPFTVAASATSGLAVTLGSLTTAVCTVSGGTVTIVGVGTCTLSGDQPGNASFLAAPQVTTSLTVTKAEQTITFAAIPGKLITDPPFAVSPTASSGLAVSVTSLSPTTCQVASGTVTIAGAGNCTLQAAQPGNAYYNAAQLTTRSFAVTGTSATTNVIFTYAGTGSASFSGDGGPPSAATLNSPGYVLWRSGYPLLVSDAGNARVRSIDDFLGLIGTKAGNGVVADAGDGGLATAASLRSPAGVAMDDYGIVYVADSSSHRVRLITPFGTIQTLAGTGTAGYSGDGGFAGSAQVSQPRGIAIDYAGDVYFSDFANHRVRKITNPLLGGGGAGITTVAGTGTAGFSGDGAAATAAMLNGPTGLAFNPSGNALYISDWGNHRVRKLDLATGNVTTVAGDGTQVFGGDGGPATAAPVKLPGALAVDSGGNLYIADSNSRVRKVTPGGTIGTVAGNGAFGFSGDGGPAGFASFMGIAGLGVDSLGDIYISDAGNNRMRKVQVKMPQGINAPPVTYRTFGDPPFTLDASATSGLPLAIGTGQCSSAVVGVSGTTLTVNGVGNCTLYLEQAGDANYHPANGTFISIFVRQAGQTISFGSLADREFTTLPVALSATSSAGLAVAFSSDTPSVCTVSGTSVSLQATGTCTLAASQSGSTNYSAAVPVRRSFVVSRGSQSIAFPPVASMTFVAGGSFAIAASATSGLEVSFASATPTVCVTNAATVFVITPGTCTITADQGGDERFLPAPQVTQSVTIARMAQSITFDPPPSRAFGGAPFGVAATSSSGLSVTLASSTPAVCAVSGGEVALLAAGTCTLAADQPGNALYLPAAQVVRSFSVTRGPQTVDLAPLSPRTLGEAPFDVSVTSSSGLPVALSSRTPSACTVAGATVTLVAAGTCTLVAGQSGDGNYEAAEEVVRSFEVVSSGSPSVVVPNPSTLAFGGQSMNTTSPSQAVTITNTGSNSITVTSVTVSTYFAVTHNCRALAPAASCTATVTFTPTAQGSLNGTLTVASDGGNPTVSLSGTGERSLVTHYYRSILRRAPDSGGKTFWEAEAARVQALGASVNEVWFAMSGSFYFSAEYFAFARDNTGFVTDLYNTFFNRTPDAGGLSFWKGQLDSGLPREVALAAFMFSTEFGNFTQAIFGSTAVRAEINTVVDFYRGLLSRLPDDGGFNFWLGRFRTAQCAGGAAVIAEVESISSLFANSQEYANRARTNAQYVGDLYNAFLRRGGDLGGVLFWINEITSGARTRENVRQAFVASPEFQNRVAAIIAQGCLP